MTTIHRIPHFTPEDLELPVTWRSMTEVHIPLGFALRKLGRQLFLQVGALTGGGLTLMFVMHLTFRPLMHALKPVVADANVRGDIYLALVVLILWGLSRLCFKSRLRRLQCLLHLVPALAVAATVVFAGG